MIKAAIYGAGAMGGTLGALIEKSGGTIDTQERLNASLLGGSNLVYRSPRNFHARRNARAHAAKRQIRRDFPDDETAR